MMKKIKALPIIKKLNSYRFMPVIWWSLLVILLHYLANVLQFMPIIGFGLISLIINNVISYRIGKIICERKLKRYWLWCLPIAFCLSVLPLPSYNLLFGLIYLIFEIFGLMEGNVYRQKG